MMETNEQPETVVELIEGVFNMTKPLKTTTLLPTKKKERLNLKIRWF